MAEAENIFRNNFTLHVFEIDHYTYVLYYLIFAYVSALTLRNDYISLLPSLRSSIPSQESTHIYTGGTGSFVDSRVPTDHSVSGATNM